jgi:hypothetical protein
MATQSDKKESGSSSNEEVTAEWIVTAKLKINSKPKKASSFGIGDCGAKRSMTGSPCRVVYKWNSDEKKVKMFGNRKVFFEGK